MKHYNFPAGYSFFTSYFRAVKLVNDPIETMTESIHRFGDSYSVFSGVFQKSILTQDPEFIEYVLKKNHKNYYKSKMASEKLGRFLGRGLLTSNGSYWLQQRRLIQPGFHHQKIAALYQIMKETIDRFIFNSVPSGLVDIYPVANQLAFEIVINTLFDVDLSESARRDLSIFISETQDFVIRDIRQPYKSWWYTISGEVSRNFKRAGKAREVIRKLIEQRRSSGKNFNDLLDMLMNVRYEDTGKPMNDDQIIDEILVLIIAGHETTANALSWTLYLLAQHPGILEKLRNSTKGLAIPDVIKHPYLNAVLSESMRLYPPAWITDRVALEDDSFKDYSFPKDTIIILFFYGMHRAEKYWPQGDLFNPERFIEQNTSKTKAYYPFGGGPRLCIGNNFAVAEMCLFLQAFIHAFDIAASGTHPLMKPLVTLRPDKVMLQIQKRM